MSQSPTHHHRRSIRQKGYDYAQEGIYFITICVQDRLCLFGRVENGEMVLNEFGNVAQNELLITTKIRSNVQLDAFVVMPNHVHVIIHITHSIDPSDATCRGELHSPINETDECNSPNNETGELHSPINETDECNSPINETDELHSPNNETDECNSPINETDELNSPINETGECNSPINETGECNSPINETGECNSPINENVDNTRGECNSPLRGPSQTVGAIVRGYKSAVTKQLKTLGFSGKLWQRNYYEIIIRTPESYENISNYIENNPANWKKDKFNNRSSNPV